MIIHDTDGCITDDRIPLVPLHDIVSRHAVANEAELLARIKHAKLYLVGQNQEERIDNKTRGYFEQLRTLGILRGAKLMDQTLLHEVKGQFSKLIGVNMPGGRIHYLHLMSSDKVVPQTLRRLEQTDRLAIKTLTGICLFGSGVDVAITQEGDYLPVSEVGGLLPEIPDSRIVDVIIHQRLSLYEAYKIKHFSSLLNGLHAACECDYQEAYLMTPANQYPLYLVPAFIEGKVSSAVFAKWAYAARHRAECVYRIFAKRLRVPLTLLPSPLASVIDYITACIAANHPPSLEQVLERLGNEDVFWAALLTEPENIPKDWRELKLLSYVKSVMETAKVAEQQDTILVAVDDLSEKPMANAYAKVRRKLKRQDFELPAILGLYSPAGIVAEDRSQNSYLYGHTSGSGKDLKTIVKAYRSQPSAWDFPA